jgi:hypothetical protein
VRILRELFFISAILAIMELGVLIGSGKITFVSGVLLALYGGIVLGFYTK